MARRRGFAIQVLLPLCLLVVAFVLAAVRPGHRMSAASSPLPYTLSTAENLEASSRLTGPSREPVFLPVVAFGAGLIVALTIVAAIARMIIRRRPAEQGRVRATERSTGAGTDLLLIGIVALVGAGLFLGLRTVVTVRSRGEPVLQLEETKDQIAKRTPPAAPMALTPSPVGRSTPFDPTAVVILAAFGLLVVLFALIRGRDRRARALIWVPGRRRLDRAPHSVENEAVRDTTTLYRTMCRVLDPLVPGRSSQTPREYLQALEKAGIECEEIVLLTRLFEYERYAFGSETTKHGQPAQSRIGNGRVVGRSPAELLSSIRRYVESVGKGG